MFKMEKFLKVALLSLGVATISFGCYQPEFNEGGVYSVNPNRHVLYLGWDGVRPDALEVANTPTIDKLRTEGAIYTTGEVGGRLNPKPDSWAGYVPKKGRTLDLTRIAFNPYSGTSREDGYQSTSSWPGWSSMATGVYANKHGVYHNYDNDSPNFIKYPHFFEHIKAYSQNTFLASIMSWTPFSTAVSDYADYLYHTIRVDGAISGAVKEILTNNNIIPTVIFCDFDRTDWWGHDSGFSAGTKDEPHVKPLEYLEQCDVWLGEMVDAINKRVARIEEETGVKEEWLVILTADHGGFDRDGDPVANLKGTKRPMYAEDFIKTVEDENGNWQTVYTDDVDDVSGDKIEALDAEKFKVYQGFKLPFVEGDELDSNPNRTFTYFAWWWDSNPGKGGDHGNWESGPEAVTSADLDTVRNMANITRYVPLLLWSNATTTSYDTRFSGGVAQQHLEQANDAWDIQTRERDGKPGLKWQETHHVVDLVPTVLDFLDIPIESMMDLDGTSIFRKDTSDTDSFGMNYTVDYSSWLPANDITDDNKGWDSYYTDEERNVAIENLTFYANNGKDKRAEFRKENK